jgi:hypothetical protein
VAIVLTILAQAGIDQQIWLHATFPEAQAYAEGRFQEIHVHA